MDNELTVRLAVEVVSESTLSSSKQLIDTEAQTVDEAVQTAHASVQTSEKHSSGIIRVGVTQCGNSQCHSMDLLP